MRIYRENIICIVVSDEKHVINVFILIFSSESGHEVNTVYLFFLQSIHRVGIKMTKENRHQVSSRKGSHLV